MGTSESNSMHEGLANYLADQETAFEETEREMSNPEVLADLPRYEKAARRYANLRPAVTLYRAMRVAEQDSRDALELAEVEDDPALADELREMSDSSREEADDLSARLQSMLAHKDPDDAKDVIVEIRAAAGGSEAALWAGVLLKMYQRYAGLQGFEPESMNSSSAEGGGFRAVTFAVKGEGAFGQFKYEAGVHRVQRVPKTESQGRVHTSTATVAVMPEVEEVEVEIASGEVKVDTFRSSGPGGQSVNTTDSAVRITHLPSGMVVTCQDEKSQIQNKEKAFRVLRARLRQREEAVRTARRAEGRRSQIGSGGRSEKIRTYNFRQNRVTDHRIGLTVKRLTQILEVGPVVFVEALSEAESQQRQAFDRLL